MPELTGENAAQLTDSQPAASERPIVRTSGLPSSLRDVGDKLADGVDLTVNLRFDGHRPGPGADGWMNEKPRLRRASRARMGRSGDAVASGTIEAAIIEALSGAHE